jgi:hypothetical protein
MYYADERDEVKNARNEAVARGIIEGLTSQNVTISDARDILYKTEGMLREESEKQALSDMLKNLKK